MTASRLAALLDQAIEYRTGPTWFNSDEEGMSSLRRRDEVLRVADARLIALAPDMARLLVDMAAKLRCEYHPLHCRHTPQEPMCETCALLARFAEIERRAAQ